MHEANVIGVLITVSLTPTPSATRPRCRAAVPEFSARAPSAPTNRRKSSSNLAALGPVVIQPERRLSATSSISSCPIRGGENGKNSLRPGTFRDTTVSQMRDVFVHPSAVVDPGVRIGPRTKIWHFTHVQSGARIGSDCVLGQGVYVGKGVRIGKRVKIQNNVSVFHGVRIE